MPRFATPTNPGFYWAKLVHPSRMPEGEDWASADWEVVEVFMNCLDESSPIHLGVHVGGMIPVQWIEDFVWGPKVDKPKELM